MRLAISLFIVAVGVGCGKDEPEDTGPVDADNDGFVASEDCDDSNAQVNPDAEEVCDSVDNDCDGTADGEDAADAGTWYADADGDGYGDADFVVTACELPVAHSADATDCDDSNARFHPGAVEEDCADPADYNCDGSVGYADSDGDGAPACEDCDDADASAAPDQPEVCDGVDNDCDGDVDDNASDAATWYGDSDGDGYGGSQFVLVECDAPAGFVATSDDCDDLDAASNPAATEVCDESDNDCDGVVDEEVLSTWYVDADGDGYGDSTQSQEACNLPVGHSSNGGDCDDAAAATSPAAYEICDGADNNCDGVTDEATAIDVQEWYADSDGDGFGDSAVTTEACSPPTGFVSDATDCDDTSSAVNSAAVEVCDAVDNNCDGDVDEDSATDATTWYFDYDADGYGEATVTATACTVPTSYVDNADDCAPADGSIHPAATEACDGIDNNCDGVTNADEIDDDGDGFLACAECDDADAGSHPGATQVCDDVDHDCDGLVDFDADNDGFSDMACGGSDCVDSDLAIYPDVNGDCFYCGDGLIQTGEDCDDGASADSDGCSSGCVIESNSICSGEPSVCEVDAEPDAFSFVATDRAEFDTAVESDAITVSGFHGSLEATVSSSQVTPSLVVNGVDMGATTAAVVEGDTLAVLMLSGSDYEVVHEAVVSLGSETSTWTLSTKGQCIGGTQSFTDVTDGDGDGFADSTAFTVPEGCEELEVILWGAGGGGGGDYCGFGGGKGGDGGAGGFASGTISVTPFESLDVTVGLGGNGRSYSIATDGGGHSALFRSSTPLIIAGGGGGAAGAWHSYNGAHGGAGGGLEGLPGGSGSGGGGAGGTQASGGGGSGGGTTSGGYLFGGDRTTTGHSGTGTGGSGYYGGGSGGGCGSSCTAGGAGGGGSSFIPTGGETLAGSGSTPANTSHSDYPGSSGFGGLAPGDCVQQGNSGSDGYVLIRWHSN